MMVLTLLRATSRKAFGSLVTRKITYNRNDKEQSKNASDKKTFQCKLEGFIDFQRMVFHSIGIFGSLIIIGSKFHTDCIRYKSSGNFQPSVDNSCTFLHSLNKNLLDLGSHHYNHLNVLPLHILPGSSSIPCESTSKHQPSCKDDTTIIDKIVQNMRSELDLFTDEIKNIQASVLLHGKQVDKAIDLLKSCPNSAKAMFNLGVVYESGQHDPINGIPNYASALKYYTNAANLGHRLAHYNLALIYLYGKQPIQADRATGMSLLHRAAELGVEEAQNFVRQESLNRFKKRDQRIRHSQELFDAINKKSDITINNFHTSRSSPDFLTTIIGHLEPSVKDFSSKPISMDDDLLCLKGETIYDSDDSLEVIFAK